MVASIFDGIMERAREKKNPNEMKFESLKNCVFFFLGFHLWKNPCK